MKNRYAPFLLMPIVSICLIFFIVGSFSAVFAQAIIKTGEDSFFRLGAVSQFQMQAVQESLTAKQDSAGEAQHWQHQMQIRRCRIVLEGSFPKTVFHFEMDVANAIGSLVAGTSPVKNGFANGGGGTANLNILDLWVEHTFAPEFMIIAGLQLDGLTRNYLLSLPRFMALNFGAFEIAPTGTPLQNNGGRDVGITFKGYLADDRLEYRAGVYTGRSFDLQSPLHTVLRLNYEFLDKEKVYAYAGSTLGKGKVLAISGGVDAQGSYLGASGDIFFDHPLGDVGSLTAYAALSLLNGGNTDNAKSLTKFIPTQSIVYSELGYYFKDVKLQPYLKYEAEIMNGTAIQYGGQDATASGTNYISSAKLDYLRKIGSTVILPDNSRFAVPGTGSRFGIGLNYYPNGYNLTLKLLWENVSHYRDVLQSSPDFGAAAQLVSTNEITFQLQWFLQ